jgi:hypothetical protein
MNRHLIRITDYLIERKINRVYFEKRTVTSVLKKHIQSLQNVYLTLHFSQQKITS